MEYLLSTVSSVSNYKLYNSNNINNLIIELLLRQDKDGRIKTIDACKLHIGMTFYDQLKEYINRKLGKTELNQFINNL